MKSVLISLIIFVLLEKGCCIPGDELKKIDNKRPLIPPIYYSLDLSKNLSKSICVCEKKEIDGDLYKDITIRPNVFVNEVYNGTMEVWKGKPNRDLMKLMIIQKKENTTYIVITKDKADRLAETQVTVTKVTLTFNPYQDLDFPPTNRNKEPLEPKTKQLKSSEAQTDFKGPVELKDLKYRKSPFQNREYIRDLLPNFVAKNKLAEIKEEEEQESTTQQLPLIKPPY